MAAFQNRSVVSPIFCLLLCWVWLLCGHTSEPGKPPRIAPGSSLLSHFHLCFSTCPLWSRNRAQTPIAQPWFMLIFPGVQSTMKQRLAAPLGAQGAPSWLFAALLWFHPVVSGTSEPQQSLSAFSFSGFAAARPWWLLPCWESGWVFTPRRGIRWDRKLHPFSGCNWAPRVRMSSSLSTMRVHCKFTARFLFCLLIPAFPAVGFPVESFLIYTCLKYKPEFFSLMVFSQLIFQEVRIQISLCWDNSVALGALNL